MGSIVIKLPLPPGCLPTLWQQDERMRDSYLIEFPGYYKTADAGFVDPEGYLYIMGRTDDIINVAGHRLSTGGMEEVLASHPDVAECAVIGMKDEIKGEQPCGFVVLKSGVTRPHEEIEKELVKLVRDKIGPVAAFKIAITVARLPKTRSGKILRGTMKKIADGDSWSMPATIEDPKALDEIKELLEARARWRQKGPAAKRRAALGEWETDQNPLVTGAKTADFAKCGRSARSCVGKTPETSAAQLNSLQQTEQRIYSQEQRII